MRTVRIRKNDSSDIELGEMDFDSVAKLWEDEKWVFDATCGYNFDVLAEQDPGFIEFRTGGALLKIIVYTGGYEVYLDVKKGRRKYGLFPADYEFYRLSTLAESLEAVRIFFDHSSGEFPALFEKWNVECLARDMKTDP